MITDYNMPRMDGLAMVAEMRKLRSHDDLAIIGISDSTRQGTLARFLKGGATDYLNKPFCVEEFVCLQVLGEGMDPQGCLERIRAAIAAIGLHSDGRPVPITASIGATRRLRDNIDQMLADADQAVYAAKRAGRNRVVLA